MRGGSILRYIYKSSDARTQKMNVNIYVSFFLKGISILISFILVPMTLSCLTPFEYGIWLTLSSILQWLDYFDIGLGNGLRNKLTEAIAHNDYTLGRKYVSSTYFFLSIIVLISLVLFTIVNSFLDWNSILNANNEVPHLKEIVLIIFALCCLNFVIKNVGIIYIAHQQPMVNNLISVVGQLFALTFIFILMHLTEGDLGKVAIAFSISPLLAYLGAYPYTFCYKYKSLSPSFSCIDVKCARSLISLGVKFFFIQIACLLLFSTSNLIISRLFSPSEVTTYNIAFKYINVVQMIFVILQTPVWSAITDAYARKEFDWIRLAINRQLKIWVGCLLGIVLLLLVNRFVIYLWIGDAVQVPLTLLVILSLYQVVLMFSMIFSSFSNGTGRLKSQIISAIIQGICYIPLALFLARFLGVNGIALALVIVTCIPAVVLYMDYKHFIKSKL
jgi:O-antigen/teichoic acid export membrane protein